MRALFLILIAQTGCMSTTWRPHHRQVELELSDGKKARAWLPDAKTGWRTDALTANSYRVCRNEHCAIVVRVESCTPGCTHGDCTLRRECPDDGDLLRLADPLAFAVTKHAALELTPEVGIRVALDGTGTGIHPGLRLGAIFR